MQFYKVKKWLSKENNHENQCINNPDSNDLYNLFQRHRFDFEIDGDIKK